MKVIPVIHYLDSQTALEQSSLAFDAGADGVFLISHDGLDSQLPAVGESIKSANPNKLVGLNFLRDGVENACYKAIDYGLDMVWGDFCGVSSFGLDDLGHRLRYLINEYQDLQLFASVAFKYQPLEKNPALAAKIALDAGFMPTTSGVGTGEPPTVEKICEMSAAVNGALAVASGMSVENISDYSKYLSHVLVATSVSRDEHHFDYETLSRFISLSRQP